ncbi:ubiquitin interaction domain-containing protein [Colletotrichum graminicola M1.001]|uniref:Ubiquitin interaction domain-containing protein n=1 Tax=Colletotrichum graminicola (strain M1.001 / M2 / FGSC 10212) TaxID=645133 RepID=E3QAR8_COLGM|nr:ubiquitin interaction domain-containing protein [Colletotrichum graminicola M1.001]EFQ27956.1 ubiquitin interaction domain-containing protein [Colletotrichum graminicola M1.001]
MRTQSNTSLEQLIGEYYEGSDAFRRKYTWDDTAFGAGREGEPNNTGIAFNIEAPDNAVIQGVTPPPDTGFYGPSVGAPSRPPSRTNNRSPLGRMIEWTAGDTTGAPSSAEQYEEDLQRALRESQADAGFKPQEAGVTDTGANATYFGPANRPDYDQNSWAMVTTATTSSQAVVNGDPPPSARKREEGAPAFLIQKPNARNSSQRLGSVLTILHEIPLARNVLLQAGKPAASYGHNSEWWKGQPIYAPHVLAAMQQGELQWSEESKPDFHEEIHRLMAFLDLTERSYGSVETMADLVPKTNFSPERQFYDTLDEKTDAEVLKPLTHVACPLSLQTFEPTQEPTRFAFLNFELTKSQCEQTKTLYDAWNWIVWHESMTWAELQPNMGMVVLDDMGEIMTVNIDAEDPPEKLEIPEVWYPERYLVSRKEEARVCQEHLAWISRALYEANSKEFDLTKWVDPKTDKLHDKEEMLEKTIKEYESHVQYLDGLGRFRELQKLENEDEKQYTRLEDVPCVKTEAEEALAKSSQQVVDRCVWELSQLRETKKRLDWERERLIERQQLVSSTLLTDPNKPGLTKPFTSKKYLLRGIATSQNVTYVCKRAEPALIDFEEASAPVDQWWRLSYEQGSANPAKAEKCSFEQVMEKMFWETKGPLLVYATEDAINTPVSPLSDALQRFARAENKNFKQELNQESIDESVQSRNTNMSPISPSKRKYRSGSVDSMATNRASLGNSDTNSRAGDFDNDPFSDGDGTMDTEMTDMASRQGATEMSSASLAEFMHSGDIHDTARPRNTNPPSPGQHGLSVPTTADDISRTVTPDIEDQTKGPEMQERLGSPFMARHSIYGMAHDPRDEQKTMKMMDMEIPDEHQ